MGACGVVAAGALDISSVLSAASCADARAPCDIPNDPPLQAHPVPRAAEYSA
jgi:hypothetical protein